MWRKFSGGILEPEAKKLNPHMMLASETEPMQDTIVEDLCSNH